MPERGTAATFELAPGGGAGRYRLSGTLNVETASAVLATGTAAFGAEQSLALDLSGITNADSAGLAVLLTWVERARREGRSLAFTSMPPQLVKIAKLCAVEPLLGAAARSAAAG